jgi:hypothetical protein
MQGKPRSKEYIAQIAKRYKELTAQDVKPNIIAKRFGIPLCTLRLYVKNGAGRHAP